MEGLYRGASDPVLRTHLLTAWRISLGDSIRVVGYSKKWTREIAWRYKSEGVEGFGDRRHAKLGVLEDRAALRPEFPTEPKGRGPEIRCFMRDPDGYHIEVGQSTRLVDREDII